MGRPGAIDPAHTLGEPRRTPGQIVVDHAHRVLEIQTLAQEIGRHEDVGLKSGGGQGCALRARREGAEHLIAPGGSRPEPAALPDDRDHAEAMESPDQVTDCCPGLREDDRLARPACEQPDEHVGLGIQGRGRQRAQPAHELPVPRGHGAGSGGQHQREERELQVVRSRGEQPPEVFALE